MVHKTQNMLPYLSLPTHSGLELVLKLFSRPFEGQNQQPMKNRFTKQYITRVFPLCAILTAESRQTLETGLITRTY